MSLEKISFNGKQISVRKAKTIYNLMKWGWYTPELDDKEKIAYVEWFQKNRDEESINLKPRGKPLMVPVNERGYLIMNLHLGLIHKGLLNSIGRYDKKYGDLTRPKPIKNVTFDSYE
ncbi:MAG: hypothetical protein NTZ83_05410 [Candidatus Pacearchaeota archaeon]|nr:hypothetical protein [Candidatus Pacearchaeota archaeon]